MENAKIVIYKDKSYEVVLDGITWEYENDPDWFMTVEMKNILSNKKELES